MRLPFGFELSRKKALGGQSLQSVTSSNSWWPIVVREPFTGAWQRNQELTPPNLLAFGAVYACVTLIASDVAKCRPRIVEQLDNVWIERHVPAFSTVLERPNHFQNRIQFIENWVVSKLLFGNTYILKEYDDRGTVSAMYIMDPKRSAPLVAPDGSVYYRFGKDNLSGVGADFESDTDVLYVPADMVIHDVMVPLYHPLCGVSPLTACGVAAMQGLAIQRGSTEFFSNGAMPSGVLTAPHTIDDITAARIKSAFETVTGGANRGRVAVLGDGLKYEGMTMKSTDAQLIEQLKWTGEQVCGAFKVPPYKVNIGAAPAYNNVEALDQQYYSQCLQMMFECIELALDFGLGLKDHKEHVYGVEFDLDDLFRMDTMTLISAEVAAVGGGIRTPNEARRRLNARPVQGGDTPYLQQQNYSLAALDARDRSEDPFRSNGGQGAGSASNSNASDDATDDDAELATQAAAAVAFMKVAAHVHEI